MIPLTAAWTAGFIHGPREHLFGSVVRFGLAGWRAPKSGDVVKISEKKPWFLAEGLLWAALGLVFVAASRRRAWIRWATVACLALTVVGVLSGLDVIGSFRIG